MANPWTVVFMLLVVLGFIQSVHLVYHHTHDTCVGNGTQALEYTDDSHLDLPRS